MLLDSLLLSLYHSIKYPTYIQLTLMYRYYIYVYFLSVYCLLEIGKYEVTKVIQNVETRHLENFVNASMSLYLKKNRSARRLHLLTFLISPNIIKISYTDTHVRPAWYVNRKLVTCLGRGFCPNDCWRSLINIIKIKVSP